MEFIYFKWVIAEFRDSPAKPRIEMDFAGEPTLNPNVHTLVRYAHEMGHHTYISTNTTVLTRELSTELIKAGLDSIHLCLDGITADAHEAYRMGSRFGQIKENIETFIRIKRELGARNPQCIIQTLLTSFSEGQTLELTDWARKIGADAISFKSLSMGTHSPPELRQKYAYLLPKNVELRRKSSVVRKRLCPVIPHQAVVYWNGDVGLCCADYYGEILLGNVTQNGLMHTITSEQALEQRKRGLLRQHDMCQTCPVADADFVRINVNFS